MNEQMMLDEYKSLVEKNLISYVVNKNAPEILKKSMCYSLSAGGKRLRPALMLEFYRLLGGNKEDILNFACAIEMIHTYSLIHDDLPCMDDDDLRRGKPSNHKAFGEANALLAGDALLTLSFETAADYNKNIKPQNAVKAIGLIANAAGMCNMVGGQVLDLESEEKNITLEQLNEIQKGKTVALLKVCGSVACALAEANEEQTKAVHKYLVNIGRAFQIRDDILDVIGSEKELGKPIGSDFDCNKNTFVSLIGIERSKQMIFELTRDAISAIRAEFKDCDNLCSLAEMLATRNK